MQLICGLAASVCLTKDSVEEAARGLRLLGCLLVIEWQRMLEVDFRLRHGAVNMYQSCTLVGIVAMDEGLCGLFGEAERRV